MTLIDQVLELTAQVEQLLDSADWSGAATLEGERQRLLGQLCEGERIRALDQDDRQILRALLARNQRAIERLERERRGMSRLAGQLSRGPAAVQAYRNNQDGGSSRRPGEPT